MLSQIVLIRLFCSPYYHEAAAWCFLFSLAYQRHTNKELASLADSWITRFELFHKIPLILYCEPLQHIAKEICSSYFISLPKSRWLDC